MFESIRRVYARLLDVALEIRWVIVAVALLVTAAAWPLYANSRRELAPVEDQSHISLFFEAPPDSTVEALEAFFSPAGRVLGGPAAVSDDLLEVLDLRPRGIIQTLDLLRPIYKKTAAYGHFGRSDVDFPWEATDKADDLKSALGL